MNLLDFVNKFIALIELFAKLLSKTDLLLEVITRIVLKRLGPTYENLDLDVMVDIRDRRGRVAIVSRRQAVRFLTAGNGIIRDLVWGDGVAMARYVVDGAHRLSVQPEGSKKAVLLGLGRQAHRGEKVVVSSRRLIKGGFTARSEYYEMLAERPTQKMSMRIVFPASRPPREARIAALPPLERSRRVPVRYDKSGRPFLAWTALRPACFRIYGLQWSW